MNLDTLKYRIIEKISYGESKYYIPQMKRKYGIFWKNISSYTESYTHRVLPQFASAKYSMRRSKSNGTSFSSKEQAIQFIELCIEKFKTYEVATKNLKIKERNIIPYERK